MACKFHYGTFGYVDSNSENGMRSQMYPSEGGDANIFADQILVGNIAATTSFDFMTNGNRILSNRDLPPYVQRNWVSNTKISTIIFVP